MRILEVLPTYPGDPFDGSAVYERLLNRALIAQGTHIEVLTTRAARLRHEEPFYIRWPHELPARDTHEGVEIRRFRAIDAGRIARGAGDAVVRRWSREDARDGVVAPESVGFGDSAVAQARRRPGRIDLFADIGRGPVVPGVAAELMRRASEFDVILAGYVPFSLPRQTIWAATRAGVPVVLLPFFHEKDRYHHFRSFIATFERAAAVLTLSAHTVDFLRMHVPGCNAVALGAGVTVPGEPRVSAGEFRARHGLGEDPILLFVGRKEPSKRYDLAVEALKHLPEDVQLVMVGRDADGRPIESGRVRYLGALPDDELAAAYEACNVFVLPSQFESFGMVFLDAWLRGKPVIGNRTCGASAALIRDGVDGYLCRDADEIADAARRLLDQPELSARMGASGRQRTLEEFTWERVADRALSVFRSVSAGASVTPEVR